VCLCYSTDGVDGPTDAAGAIVTSDTLQLARAHGLDPLRALREHDSFGFFVELGAAAGGAAVHVRTGPTGTNVNHVAVLLT
jgi:glycerate-2-kinase